MKRLVIVLTCTLLATIVLGCGKKKPSGDIPDPTPPTDQPLNKNN